MKRRAALHVWGMTVAPGVARCACRRRQRPSPELAVVLRVTAMKESRRSSCRLGSTNVTAHDNCVARWEMP